MNKIDVFYFAEDWVREGEPDFASFLLIHEHRRDYFWEVQNRVESSNRLDSSSLPAKDSEIEGGGGYTLASPNHSQRQEQNFGENCPQRPCFAAEETGISFTIIGFILRSFLRSSDGQVRMIKKLLTG